MANWAVESFFPTISEVQKNQFIQFEESFLLVNKRVNLISRKDEDNFFVNHLLHSLSIAHFYKFNAGTDILDLGTGGGLPGIPLAIMFPEVNFLLCDSIRKKLTAVEEMAQILQLKNVSIAWQRAESIDARFDFVVSRAVAPIVDLWQWTKKLIHNNQRNQVKNGLLLLKGGDLQLEINQWQKSLPKQTPLSPNHQIQQLELKDFCKEPFFETKKLLYIPKF